MSFITGGFQPPAMGGPIRSAWRQNRSLATLAVLMIAMIAVSLAGLAFDPRIITGVPAWMKPLKFAISIAVYSGTLLWLLTFIPNRPRLVAAGAAEVAIALTLEMVLIVLQVMRGTTSHFNQATAFDASVFRVMGALISGVWLLNFGLAALLSRRQFASPPLVWGVRLGLLGALLGMAVAFLMVMPTAEQRDLIAAQGSSTIIGGHAVGVADGGPGLPVVGWSTIGGDLRVAHFFGLHALQVVPIIALLLTRFSPAWLQIRQQTRLVAIAGISWIGLMVLLTWQALRAQPVLAPDAVTTLALAGLVGLVAGGSGLVLWQARREMPSEIGSEVGMGMVNAASEQSGEGRSNYRQDGLRRSRAQSLTI